MKNYEAAIESFEVVAAIAPQMPKTYRWLLDLYEIVGDEEKSDRYRKIVDHYDLGEKIVVTGLPGEKLEETLQKIKDKGIEIGGDINDLLGDTVDVLNPNWFADLGQKINYIPLRVLGSLPPKFSYRIMFVNDDSEDVMRHLVEKEWPGKETFNPDLMDGVREQERRARTWLSQQPNLDLFYINLPDEVDNELITHYLS